MANVVDNITVAELISRIKGGELGNSEIEGLVEKLARLSGVEVNISNVDEVIKFLEGLSQGEPVEEIEKVEVEEPKSDLNKLKIDELVDAYDKATDEKEKDKIKLEIARQQKVEISEVDRMIKRQHEIAREQAILRDKNLEKINDEKEIKNIEKVEKISQEEAKEILDQAKMAEAKLRVDNFVEKTVERSGEDTYENLIKVEMTKVISGDSGKMEMPSGVDPIIAKQIELEMRKFIKNNPKTVRQNELERINEEFKLLKQKTSSREVSEEVEEYRKSIIKFRNVSSTDLLTNNSRNDAQIKLERENGIGTGQSEASIYKTQLIVDSIHHPIKQFGDFLKQTRLSDEAQKLVLETKTGRAFMSVLDGYKNNPVMQKIRDVANYRVKMVEFATKIPGVNTALVGISEIAGFEAAKDFILLSTQVMAEQGTIPGAIAILKALTTGAGVLEGPAGVEGLTTLSSMLGAFQGIPVLGQVVIVVAMVILAGMWIFDHIIKPLFNSINDFLKRNLNLNLGGIRDFFANDLNLGGFLGGVAQVAFTAGTAAMGFLALLFGPMWALGMATMTAIVTPVVVGLLAGFMVYQLFITQPMIAALVPPPPQATGGTCQPKDPTTGGGINCNQDAPENNTGIDKANFVLKANQWHPAGKNYSEECFNDVVNRALCAGVNPQYALWAWLHESAASNYSIPNVEDFGIHNQSAATKDFNEQINAFLKLDPGTACSNLPYWLSFATNYLTGECDPKKEIPQADGTMMTGEKYLEGMKSQWSWIKPGDLNSVSNIHVDKGGSQCNGSDKKDLPYNEYVRSDGTLMLCDGPVDENGNFIGNGDQSYNYDENAKAEPGQTFPGTKCSVASKVVKTTQCWESWSNKGLPGGGGTICSAGCGPSTVSSMLRSGPNGNTTLTPDTVIFEPNSPYNTSGYKMNGDGSSLTEAKKSLQNHGFKTGEVQSSCSQEAIKNWICAGKAVMIVGPTYTGPGGGTIGHIRVMVAVDEKLITVDPYYKNQYPFDDTKGIVEGRVAGPLEGCLTVDLGKD